MSQGWALGTPEFKAMLIKDHAIAAESRAWESTGAREIRQLRWTEALDRCLQRLGRSATAVRSEPKSARWKAAIASHLKATTQASNRWLTEHLHMGRPEAVSVYVRRLRSRNPGADPHYQKLITNV